MGFGPVKDANNVELNTGDKVQVVEDILYVEEGLNIKNKIPKDTIFTVTGFPTNDNYIQVKYGNIDWAITAKKVKKI